MTTPTDLLHALLSDLTVAVILGERAETAGDRRLAIVREQQVMALREQIVARYAPPVATQTSGETSVCLQ